MFDLGGDVGITKIGPVLASMRVLDDMQNFLKELCVLSRVEGGNRSIGFPLLK